MKLHWSPRSPFVRKVMIVLHETGLVDQVECVRTVVAMSAPPNAALLPDNPLAKIPTLVLDDGKTLFDSRVIAEYLDGLHSGPKLFPEDREGRFRHLRWMAFADGLTDVLLLWRNERIRPEGTQHPVILAAFETKVRHAFAAFDREAAALSADAFGIGHIALVCTLGQMDFRFGGSRWRESNPDLAAWYEAIRKRPSVAATEVRDDGSGPPEVPWAAGPALVFA
ncbi:glutathione S-transferase family protein [Pseudochelatococcus sp. B33]